jgi:hypothetical protein
LLNRVCWDEADEGRIGLHSIRRIAAGEANPCERADLVAALAALALGPPDALGPELVHARPAFPDLGHDLGSLSPALSLNPGTPSREILALAAGLLQVHDFWEASHTAAQEADDQGERETSAYWHGIAHRREPDAWNANYWFRRVGRHPLFEPLGRAAAALLDACGQPPGARKIVVDGIWSPPAFIDFVTQSRPGSPDAVLARRLQRLEMALLLDHSAQAAGIAF